MFISQEDAEKRLEDPANIFRGPSSPALLEDEQDEVEPEPPPLPGNIDPRKLASLNSEILNGLRRGEGKAKRLHPAVRVGIAEAGLITGPTMAAALGDVSHNSAASYGVGGHNPRDARTVKHQYLLDRLAHTRAVISTRAARRLKSVLYLLDDTKLAAVETAADLSRIGKDMAVIMEKMQDKKGGEEGNSVHFHIHKPEPRDAKTYEMVKIGTEVIDSLPL